MNILVTCFHVFYKTAIVVEGGKTTMSDTLELLTYIIIKMSFQCKALKMFWQIVREC